MLVTPVAFVTASLVNTVRRLFTSMLGDPLWIPWFELDAAADDDVFGLEAWSCTLGDRLDGVVVDDEGCEVDEERAAAVGLLYGLLPPLTKNRRGSVRRIGDASPGSRVDTRRGSVRRVGDASPGSRLDTRRGSVRRVGKASPGSGADMRRGSVRRVGDALPDLRWRARGGDLGAVGLLALLVGDPVGSTKREKGRLRWGLVLVGDSAAAVGESTGA
uniref:Uncharacterized protein n=1 Tax=Eutreptiella gymnastica TaxID=73025 RepID=A0A7S1IGE7_9EUGL|mmetsp:Transcript_16684/g.29823  ORF Transcript_16684/g.29823 Transcript_16684/m.29823 type:complete len:217 (+) Transcript_16684:92-742(+)